MAEDYDSWFKRIARVAPHCWQSELGADPQCRDRLIRIPTGFGKTAGIALSWLYHRAHLSNDAWPMRLVICLPMRVLVEQTERVLGEWVARSGMNIPVFTLLGGREAARWVDRLEEPSILVGTQDMLLSRALNRGYGSARGLWPMEFAGLHNDALWVGDEVQLMDTGLATTSQLAAFRRYDVSAGHVQYRPTVTWWMSATLQPSWLQSIDFRDAVAALPRSSIPAAARDGGLWEVQKPLEVRRDLETPEDVAKLAIAKHEHETLTLVIVNTVDRANKVFAALEKAVRAARAASAPDLRLVHSRFRGAERQRWEFLHKEASLPPAGRIVVATQVVEAGVDISAKALLTDLAPWSSLVQRFGRAARRAGERAVVVVLGEVPAKDSDARPYERESLAGAAEALEHLQSTSADVGPASLESFEERLAADEPSRLARLYPYEPKHVLRRPDFEELFDTSADLSGADLDIGRYIRSGEERDLAVFWRSIEGDARFLASVSFPSRQELCPVPVAELRRYIEKGDKRAFVFDFLSGRWERKRGQDRIVPGMTVLLAADEGGYRPDGGWDPSSKSAVSIVAPDSPVEASLLEASLSTDDDALSQLVGYKTIRLHGHEARVEVERLARRIRLPDRMVCLLGLAARWHDAGKAHPVFQAAISSSARALDPHFGPRGDLAKAPPAAFCRPPYGARPGFRHELASTLLLFEVLRRSNPEHPALLGPHREMFALIGVQTLDARLDPQMDTNPLAAEIAALSADEVDLVAYLVCAHHGKVRGRLASTPLDVEADHGGIHGVVDGDIVPTVSLAGANGEPTELPTLPMSLSIAALGVGERFGASWTDRCERLRARHGPFGLAFLETVLRVADWRSSALPPETLQ